MCPKGIILRETRNALSAPFWRGQEGEANTKCVEYAILERPGRRGVSLSSLTTSAVVWRVGTFAKGSAVMTGGDVATRHSGEARKAMRELVVTDDERSSMTRRNVAEGSTVLSVEEAQCNKGAN
ncbi:hypothetical protein BU17DRAFT_60200 [Hysterangium stoloniferum]|nr:hypothetical protein BU17DRAFT_60200 [Hysterangium stoloniferum]